MQVEYIVVYFMGRREGTCTYDESTNEVSNFELDDYEEEMGNFFFDYIEFPDGKRMAVEDHLGSLSLICSNFDGFVKVKNYKEGMKALIEFDWMKEGF